LGDALEPSYQPFTTLGLILIVSGLILVLLPFIARFLPILDNVPWFIIWVYRRDGFTFMTSPLLIVLSLLSLLLQLYGRR
jgi:hypothetical protein